MATDPAAPFAVVLLAHGAILDRVAGRAAVDGCEISLTDEGGNFACPPEQVGVYTFTVSETTLTFALVSDACDGRRIPLGGAVLTKE